MSHLPGPSHFHRPCHSTLLASIYIADCKRQRGKKRREMPEYVKITAVT